MNDYVMPLGLYILTVLSTGQGWIRGGGGDLGATANL